MQQCITQEGMTRTEMNDVNLFFHVAAHPFSIFGILGAKNQLSSPRVGPLGGSNGNQDTLGVGTRSRVGYQNLVHIVQSQREKRTFLALILGGFTVEELGKFQLLPGYKICRNYFLNKKLRVRYELHVNR